MFMCFLSQVPQHHESLVNRLTYGCKPVKSREAIKNARATSAGVPSIDVKIFPKGQSDQFLPVKFGNLSVPGSCALVLKNSNC